MTKQTELVPMVHKTPSAGTIEIFKGYPAIVRKTPGGQVRSLKVPVPLSMAEKHFCRISGGIMIEAAGYEKMNLVMEWKVLPSSTIIGEDGLPHGNPIVTKNAAGYAELVRLEMVGIGRGGLGNWVVLTETLILDMKVMYAQKLLAAWSGGGQGAVKKDWGRIVGKQADITLKDTEQEYAMPDGSRLIVDLSHREMDKVRSDFVTYQTSCVKRLHTVAFRRIMARATSIHTVNDQNGHAVVNVIGWMDDARDQSAIEEMIARAREGRVNIDGDEIPFDAGDAAPVEYHEMESAHGDEEAPPTPVPDPVPTVVEHSPKSNPSSGPSLKVASVRGSIRNLHARLPSGAGDAILKTAGFNGLVDVAKCTNEDELETARFALAEAAGSGAPANTDEAPDLLPDDERTAP